MLGVIRSRTDRLNVASQASLWLERVADAWRGMIDAVHLLPFIGVAAIVIATPGPTWR